MGGKPMPKPQPACATPVADGMKVHDAVDKALQCQRRRDGIPADQPSAGLPDLRPGRRVRAAGLSLGYGRSVSRFAERKRAVAGRESRAAGRNRDDPLHPVHALRALHERNRRHLRARRHESRREPADRHLHRQDARERAVRQHHRCLPGRRADQQAVPVQGACVGADRKPSIGYHDALGSNLWLHTRRGEVLRTVPRDNEAINECWLSDRDRYSHQGMYAADRIGAPVVKRNGQWQATTWDDALAFAGEALKKAPRQRARRAGASGHLERGRRSADAAGARPRQRAHRSSPAPARFRRRRGGAAVRDAGGGHREGRARRCWSAPICATRCRCSTIACTRR